MKKSALQSIVESISDGPYLDGIVFVGWLSSLSELGVRFNTGKFWAASANGRADGGLGFSQCGVTCLFFSPTSPSRRSKPESGDRHPHPIRKGARRGHKPFPRKS